jgi:hypothetical protein
LANTLLPSDEQAFQFALMLHHGLPPESAILYFVETEDPKELALLLSKWTTSRKVATAQRQLLGKDWTQMSLDEAIDTALNQHYRSLAFLLWSVNYTSANQGEKAKLDSARTALEAKKAGTAGKVDALSSFYEDVKTGRIKLAPQAVRPS